MKTPKIAFHLSAPLLAALEASAAQHGMTRSELLRRILTDSLIPPP